MVAGDLVVAVRCDHERRRRVIRRPITRTASSVAWSAQCTSSSRTIARSASLPSSAIATPRGSPPAARLSATRPPVRAAMSTKARAASRRPGSRTSRRARVRVRRLQMRAPTAVLPTPASPPTNSHSPALGEQRVELRRAAAARSSRPDRGGRFTPLSAFEEPAPGSGRACLASVAGRQLAQDRRDVVIDRPRRQEQPLGDLGVAETVRDQREDVELAGSRARRDSARVDGRGPRGTPWTPRSRSRRATTAAAAEAPSPCSSAWARASDATLPSPRAQAPPRSCTRARPRRLRRPRRDRRAPGAYGSGSWMPVVLLDPGAPPPAQELPDQPGGVALDREGERLLGGLAHQPGPAHQPGRFGSSRCDHDDPLRLAARPCQVARFVEQLPHLRIAAPGTDEPRARPCRGCADGASCAGR